MGAIPFQGQTSPELTGSVVLLARQPIVEPSLAVQGYELLFRGADGRAWPVEDDDQATAHVVVAAFADLSLSAVTAGTRAWLNVSRSFLFDESITVLPAERVVLELLEHNVVDEDYVARAAELARAGYELALDDFTWSEAMAPLLELVTYVKLDVHELGIDGTAEHVRRLAPYGVRLLAEKVETAEERDACLALGISLFQGYFFERPALVRGRQTPHAALGRLQTTLALGPDATFEDVERVIMLDPGLSVRLLRYINSAALSLRNEISSLRQALVLVGTTTVRQWILLVLLGEVGQLRPAVIGAGLVRAKLCEILARDAGLAAADSAFMMGLLSICDALLSTPLDELVASLPLTPELADAIVHHDGALGEVLSTAIALQHGDGPVSGRHADALLAAIRWADTQLAEIPAGAQGRG